MYVLELAGQDDRFAAAEAANAVTEPSVIAPGLAETTSIDPDRVRRLAYTHRAVRVIGRTDASVEGARTLLAAAPIDRSGTAAVRTRNVRSTVDIDTQAVERELGDILVDRGFGIDLEAPDHQLRALFADGTAVLGWLVVASERDYADRAPTDKPFFQPGAMKPMDARAIANLAGAAPGRTVLDPMCGTGGILVEAGLLGASLIGADVQRRMVIGTGANLARYVDAAADLFVTDVARLPLRDRSVDAVVFDTPYGRQSKIAGRSRDAIVSAAMSEANRVAPRGVVVGDRDWRTVASEAGWTVEAVFERPVHRSLTRFVHVLASPE